MEIIKETQLKSIRLRVIRGDLTEAEADAIVNAANSHLQHGGGVAGAIVRKGGAVIQEESNRVGYVPVGESAITGGGKLRAKYVIHTVGPRWGEGDEETKLRSAVRNTLKLAHERQLKTIGMPAISAGIFGFPKERCASLIVDEIKGFAFRERATTLKEIDLYLMDGEMIDFFSRAIEQIENN